MSTQGERLSLLYIVIRRVSTQGERALSAAHCDLEGEYMGERDSLCTVHCDQEVRKEGEHTDPLFIVHCDLEERELGEHRSVSDSLHCSLWFTEVEGEHTGVRVSPLVSHGPNNYKDTKPKCRLYWCLIEIQSVMFVFSTPLVN